MVRFFSTCILATGCSLLVEERHSLFEFEDPQKIQQPDDRKTFSSFNGVEVLCVDLDHDEWPDVLVRGSLNTLSQKNSPRIRWARNLGGRSFASLQDLVDDSGQPFEHEIAIGPVRIPAVDAKAPIELLGCSHTSTACWHYLETSATHFAVTSAFAPGFATSITSVPGQPGQSVVSTIAGAGGVLTFQLDLVEFGLDGGGTIGPRISRFPNHQPLVLATGDIDGDGREDFIQYSATEHVLIVFDDQAVELGRLQPKAQVNALHFADVNGDGVLDLLVGAETDLGVSQLLIYLGKRGKLPSDPPMVSEIDRGNPQVTQIQSGDLNLDGHMDLALVFPGELVLLRGNGDGTFAEPLELPVWGSPMSVNLCDLDRDGALDLVASGGLGASVRFNRKKTH